MKKNIPVITISTFAILHANEFCLELLIDAISMMKKTPYFIHEVKMNLNAADLNRHLYEKELASIITEDNAEFFAYSNERMDEEIGRLEKILYYQIKQEMDNLRVPHSDAIAKLEECSIILRTSLVAHDEAVATLAKSGVIGINKNYLKLNAMSNLVSKAIDNLKIDIPINLDTIMVSTAYENLMNHLFNAEVIKRTIEE